MDNKPVSSRIRSLAISTVFFLAGAYSPAVSLWWGLAEPALYATPELTSRAMFLVIFGYIFAIVLGGIFGLGILHLISDRAAEGTPAMAEITETEAGFVTKAKTGKEKRICPGRYPGSWSHWFLTSVSVVYLGCRSRSKRPDQQASISGSRRLYDLVQPNARGSAK